MTAIPNYPLHAQWVQTNGPYGGRVLNFAVSGRNLIAGVSTAGIYLSTNNGTSWSCADLTTSDIVSFAAYGKYVFAGMGYNSGILLSTDNGSSWARINSANFVASAFVTVPNGASGTNIFAGGGQGLFLSTDNGVSWTQTDTEGSPISYVNTFDVSETNLFAATSNGVVLLSTDNGASWTSKSAGLPSGQIYALTVSSSGTDSADLFAGYGYIPSGSPHYVYRSTDNGSNWTASGVPTIIQALAVINGSDNTNLFAATNSQGVYRSTDNGSSWNKTSFLFNNHVWALAVGSTDSMTGGKDLFAGTNGGVALSSDNGVSWSQINDGINAVYISSLVVTDTILFAGSNGNGVFLSTDNGSTWTWPNGNSGLINSNVLSLATDGQNLFAGTSNGVWRSTDNGSSWIHAIAGVGNVMALAVSPTSNGSGTNLFAGSSNGVRLSTDNGSTWINANSGMINVWDVTAFARSDTNLFAGTISLNFDGGVYLSTNSGTSWTALNIGLPKNPVCALAVSGKNIFVGCGQPIMGSHGSGGVFRSSDNGSNWTSAGLNGFLVNALLVAGNNLFAGTNGGTFLSTDNGSSWSPVSSGLANKKVTSLAINGSNLFVGTPNGFEVTSSASSLVESSMGKGIESSTISSRPIGRKLFSGVQDSSTGTGSVWKRSLSEMISFSVVKLSSRSLDFDKVVIGQFKDSAFTLTNTGNDTLKITNIGSSNSAFVVRQKVMTIPPGSVFADTIRFTPTIAGSITAILTIASNAPSSPDRIRVSGFGFGALAMQVNAKTIAFGQVRFGTTKDTSLTLTNIGYDTLEISSVSSLRPTFTARPTVASIAPGQSLMDTLRFAPISVGADSSFILILSNSATSPDTIKVSAIASPATDVRKLSEVPKTFSLEQNYPDPFNPSTTIQYGVPLRSRVRLQIFNVLGQRIATLCDGEQSAGYQRVHWNANVSSGIYFYRIEATAINDPNKHFVDTKKMLLLK